MCGFLYRATVGSIKALTKGRMPWSQVVRVELSRNAQLRKQRALEMFQSQLSVDADVADTPILKPDMLEHFTRSFETLIHAPDT